MSLQRELDLLYGMTKLPTATQASLGLTMAQLRDVQVKALRTTAQWVIDTIVAPAMGRVKNRGDYSGGNFAGTDPPKLRTGSLQDSLMVAPGKINDVSQTVFIMVDPNARDSSSGERLQLYSRYLESGYTRYMPPRKGGGRRGHGVRESGRNLPMGSSGHTWEKKFKVPGSSQPPRPYIRQIFIQNHVERIQAKYRWEIRRLLSPARKSMMTTMSNQSLASRFKLEVTYVPPFSYSEFQGA